MSIVKDAAGIAARRRKEAAENSAVEAGYVAAAGKAAVGDVVAITGHKGVEFALGVIDETVRKARDVDSAGDNPPPFIKQGRKKVRAPPGSWAGPDKSVFLPGDDILCVKYYEPVGGIASSSLFSFPEPPQIVWVHARLVRKVKVVFGPRPSATSRRITRGGARAALAAGLKYLPAAERAACVAACNS